MKPRGNGGDFKPPGTPDSPTTKKKRRSSTAPSTPPAAQLSPMPQLIPPAPNTGYGDTIVASNPFDDSPCSSPSPMGMPRGNPCGPGPGPSMFNMPPHHNQHGHNQPHNHQVPHPYDQGMMRMGCPPQGPGPMGPNQMGPGPGQMGPGPMGPGPMHNQQWNGPPRPPMPPIPGGKKYPPDQPMVFNQQNPNAPPIYPCGVCHKEVQDNDQAIFCESGCNFCFHRICTGLTEAAFTFLKNEFYSEWVCDKCFNSRSIPPVKFKS